VSSASTKIIIVGAKEITGAGKKLTGAGPLDLFDDGCRDGGLGRLRGFEREQVSVLEEPERGGRVSQEEELVGREGSGGEAETEEKRREVVRESKGQAASAGTAQASEVGG
jgi:hypothetical protein